jgi:hypothetical protein
MLRHSFQDLNDAEDKTPYIDLSSVQSAISLSAASMTWEVVEAFDASAHSPQAVSRAQQARLLLAQGIEWIKRGQVIPAMDSLSDAPKQIPDGAIKAASLVAGVASTSVAIQIASLH